MIFLFWGYFVKESLLKHSKATPLESISVKAYGNVCVACSGTYLQLSSAVIVR